MQVRTHQIPGHTVNADFFASFFAILSGKRSFVKVKPSWNCGIALSFTDVGKSCHSRDFLTWPICLLTLLAKVKFSRKLPYLQ